MRSAVLCSGGVDSSVLLADELSRGRQVTPIHVRCGLTWEDAEARTLATLLSQAPFAGRSAPLVTLHADVRGLYPHDHWALTGTPPGLDTPDSAVYLHGRNLLLITSAAVWCQRHGVSRLAIASLAGNPFPDATPEFFESVSLTASLGLAHPIEVAAPFLSRSKADVMTRGTTLGVPLHLTLSCLNPGAGDRPCENCCKCRERREANNS